MIRVADLFAGAGGSSTGLAQAGWDVVWAGNHWKPAVDVHQRNHPHVVHVCQDLHQADWGRVPQVDVLWASPSCKGTSNAATRNLKQGRRGTGAKADAHRTTAWAVVDAAEVLRPRGLIVENVVEMRKWVLFPTWVAALQALGYSLSEHVVDANEVGVPQDRPRLFVLGLLGDKAPSLPKLRAPKVGGRLAVDLTAGTWRDVREAAAGVRRRVAQQRKTHGAAWITQSVSNHPGRTLDRPLPVITTQHQLGIVKRAGDRLLYRPFLLAEYARGMGFPESYDWTGVGVSKGSEMLGNAVCPPVAKALAEAMEAQL